MAGLACRQSGWAMYVGAAALQVAAAAASNWRPQLPAGPSRAHAARHDPPPRPTLLRAHPRTSPLF
jgi:hypothetical protein